MNNKYKKNKPTPTPPKVSVEKPNPGGKSAVPPQTMHTASSSLSTKPSDTAATLEASASSDMRTLQQQRAAFALERVQAWTKQPLDVQKKLNSYAAKMPFMVHANGLGQTAAFYRAKGEKDPHHTLYCLLGDWLKRTDQPFAGQSDLLAGVTATDLHTYVAAQAEAMLFLGWVKQFAAAFLESE